MIHYIYVAGKINGPVKIGITTDVLRRMQQLKTGVPFPLQLLFVHPAGSKESARKIEQRMHDCWSADGRKLSGEWFNVCAADALEILSIEIDCNASPAEYKKWKTLFEDAEFA
jgi:predicted GIY-YIG superfamily endonuclease